MGGISHVLFCLMALDVLPATSFLVGARTNQLQHVGVIQRAHAHANMHALSRTSFFHPVLLRRGKARPAGCMMMGWASPTWNWGSAVGDAHDEAMRIRQMLCDDSESDDPALAGANRRAWLIEVVGGSRAVEWEEVKLVLALKWQKAGRERRDGGPNGFGYVMEQMRLAKYEDAPGDTRNDSQLVSDMETRLDLVKGSEKELQNIFRLANQGENVFRDFQDAHRRAVAARVLVALDFIAQGL